MKQLLEISLKILICVIYATSCDTNSTEDNIKGCEDSFPTIEKWTLIVDEDSESKFGPFPKSGYINSKGDTTIPLDVYRCLSDTFEYFGIVHELRGNYQMFAIDKTGKKLFEAVPDGEGFAIKEYEGRIMIQKNGKFGFANHKGEIVIQPKYTCAESFYKGRARVSNKCRRSKDEHYMWESDNWIYIDKCGNEVPSNNK
ncbi:MAG: WG repeat-containing protein [Flavobacteriales bacterium]|jgi:hypothetical protein